VKERGSVYLVWAHPAVRDEPLEVLGGITMMIELDVDPFRHLW
jgi:hypothetical protein